MTFTFEHLDALRAFDKPPLPPGGVRKAMDVMMEALLKNPLLRAYAVEQLRYWKAGRDFANTRAWHAAAERQQVMLGVVSKSYDISGYLSDDVSDDDARMLLVSRLSLAAVYLWNNDIHRLTNAMPVPRHVVSRDQMAHPMMFFSFEAASPISGIDVPEGNKQTNWALLTDEGSGMSVITDIMPAKNGPVEKGEGGIKGGSIRYGEVYPDDFPEYAVNPARQVLAWLAFINSPYVDAVHKPVERQMRREFRRKGIDESVIPPVSVVVLRKATEATYRRGEGEEETRDWKSRWWVSGHICAQWYPSLKSHKLIWIAPYIKGPEGKPISARVYTVVR